MKIAVPVTDLRARRHGEREARVYIWGLVAVPPAGSRGETPGGGSGCLSPTEAVGFLAARHPTGVENPN